MQEQSTGAKPKTATLIKPLTGFTGTAKLWKLSDPLDGNDFVVTSATVAPYTGAETYIFPTDSDGKVLSWGELDGSYRGGLDHEEALQGAGYEVIS